MEVVCFGLENHRVLSWSKDRGKITINPCERGGRIYHGSRAESIWSAEEETAFLKSAPAHLHYDHRTQFA